MEDMAQYKANVDKKMEEWKKKQQTSNNSFLLSFNAPHRRSTRRNPFRRINKVIVRFCLHTKKNSVHTFIYYYILICSLDILLQNAICILYEFYLGLGTYNNLY